MASKGGSPCRARFDGRAGTSPNERFADLDIASARERVDMGAEIAVGRAREAFEPREIQPLFLRVERGQGRHDAQANGLVDDFVGGLHSSDSPHP
jgi:hypothetical protein